MQNLTVKPLNSKNRARDLGCLLTVGLLMSLGRVSAEEDPPGCSLANGGTGNTSQGGLNFTLAQAHVGDAVPVFPSLGMVAGACKAINVTGVVYVATGPLTNFLVNVTLVPGGLVACPANALCQPGPYNLLITSNMVGAGVDTPLGSASGFPKTVRAVETGLGTVLAGVFNDHLSDFHSASIDIVTPRIQVFKTCDLPPGQPCFNAGTPVRLRGYLTNSGDITLTNVVARDSRSGPLQLFNPTNGTALIGNVILPRGAYVVFSNSFLPTPAEICAGDAVSTVTATARDTTVIGGPNAAVTNSLSTSCAICTPPILALIKTCALVPAAPGQFTTVSGVVSNAGCVMLTNVFVYNDEPDPNTQLLGPITLGPGQATNFFSSYRLPPDRCSYVETVSATGQDARYGHTGKASVPTVCPTAVNPGLAIIKNCPPFPVLPGQPLLFSGVVSNAGNITLTEVTILNNQVSTNVPVLGPISLAVGESANFSGSYLVPVPAAACAASITDVVSASGTSICGGTNVTARTTNSCPIQPLSLLVVTKDCLGGPVAPGGLLSFSGTISNAGTVTLTNVIVGSDHVTNTLPVLGPFTLAPYQTTNYSGSYNVCAYCCPPYVDTISVTGAQICNGSNVAATATTSCPGRTTPRLAVTVDCPAEPTTQGGLFFYSGSVSNAGDVMVKDVIVTDIQAGTTNQIGMLAPTETADFFSFYFATDCGPAVVTTVTVSGFDLCSGAGVSQPGSAYCAINCSPDAAPKLSNPLITGGQFKCSFGTGEGRDYLVQYSDAVLPVNWQILTNFSGTGGVVTFTDPATNQKRFYRVVAQ